MRISDWSSDVCSSDLQLRRRDAPRRAGTLPRRAGQCFWRSFPCRRQTDLPLLLLADQSVLQADRRYSCLRSEEHTSELQSLMRNSYAVFCLKKKTSTLSSFKHQYAIPFITYGI